MKAIHKLITYALDHQLIESMDTDYVNNQLSYLLGVSPAPFKRVSYSNESIDAILKPLLDFAYQHQRFESDTLTERDLFESLLMDILTPKPSDLQKRFDALYQIDPEKATDDFYHRSQASNYIKMARIRKNTHFITPTEYGEMDITINLSKPEKDPALIAKALKESKTSYPSCLLCKENVGYFGSLNHPARSNHRIIKVYINQEPFYMQFSPYVYYNEHTILLHEKHIPMEISVKTFKRLLDFVDLFPHYFMGSNAGLPIVGGSILNHEHYQGGRATFPLDHAKILKTFTFDQFELEVLHWPLSSIRIKSNDKKALIKLAETIRGAWLNYSNEALNIHSHTNDTPHNAITPIARKHDLTYSLTIAFRNNKTSKTYPDGIFHPHQDKHHIKKENIGLIEVMGLAILPGRLDQDLKIIKKALINNQKLDEALSVYQPWFDALKKQDLPKESLDETLNLEVGKIFKEALEDCGVFKQTKEGQDAFMSFIKEIINDYKNH
ncbi:MAG: UDP-glucose--hexose-1-phosphate uridylyltransferase [Candidatus Izemoplasmataceae bacterium]